MRINSRLHDTFDLFPRLAAALVLLLYVSSPAVADIMVVAPHPDDDVISAGGVTVRAQLNNEAATIVYMTNGDYGGVGLGLDRQVEAVEGQVTHIGLTEDNLVFLGYPDGYLEDIYEDYQSSSSQFVAPNGQSQTYGTRGIGQTDYHSYWTGSPAPYNRVSIVQDLSQAILQFRPDHIFVTSEHDTHADHSTTAQLLDLALAAAAQTDPTYHPIVHRTLIWTPDPLDVWPNPLDPFVPFDAAPDLTHTDLVWAERESLDVPLALQLPNYPENSKYQAIGAHVSQGELSGYLGRFVHRDEFFWADRPTSSNEPPIANAGAKQTVQEGATVQLDGGGSFDPDNVITYQWRQVAGPLVALDNTNVASPTFTAPTGLSRDEYLEFELIVGDAVGQSYPDAVIVEVLATSGLVLGQNVATAGVAAASSERTGSTADRAVDGFIDGYPDDSSREWVTNHQGAGAWLSLNLPQSLTVGRIVLYDRPNGDDHIQGGTIQFSDGSSLQVGALDNWGRSSIIDFPPRTIDSLTFTVDSVGADTRNIGLSELQLFSVGGDVNREPFADAGAVQTVGEADLVQLDGSNSFDLDGDPLSYSWTQTSGPGVALSDPTAVSPTFVAPSGLIVDEVLDFELVVNDGEFVSSASTVQVTVQAAAAPGGTNIAPLASSVTASSERDYRGQGATSAIDGFIDGYPDDSTREWATEVERVGAWIQLDWSVPQTINRVVLYDRPNDSDQILGATLTFSDGSSETAGVLDNGGGATEILLTPRTVTSARMTVTQVSGSTWEAGLAEFEVYTADSGANRPPSADAGVAQTMNESDVVQLDGSGSLDPDGDMLSYSWSQTSGTGVALSDPTAVLPTFVAPSGLSADEVLVFQLVVNDGSLNSGPAAVPVTVLAAPPPNAAPSADAGVPQTVNESELVQLDGSGSSDPDGDPLSYSWSQTSGIGVVLSNATAVSPTFVAPSGLAADEVLTFQLVVNDGSLNSSPAVVQVTVLAAPPGNTAPSANAGVAQTVDESDLVQLDGSGSSDPDGDSLSYSWSQTSGTVVALSDPTAVSPTFVAPSGLVVNEVLAFQLVVNDGALNSTPAAVQVTVLVANTGPSADAGVPQTVNEADLVQLDGSGSSDPDGDLLSYSWSQTSGTGVALSDPTAVSPTFVAPSGLAADEVLTFQLVVNDGSLNSSPAVVQVTVLAAPPGNTAPSANAGVAQTVDESDLVQLDGSGSSDPDGDSLSYSWSQTSGTVVALSDPTAVSPTFVAPSGLVVNEVLAFQLVVNDGALNSTPAAVQVTVLVANTGPSADAGVPQTVNEADLVQLDGSGSSDPDGDLLSYSWSQTSGTGVALSDPTAVSPTFVAPSGLAADEVLTFQLVVNDGLLNSSPATVQVTISATPPPGGTNVAPLATSVTASSERDYRGQGATSAIDGFIDGYPGDSTREWATEVERVGAWIQLNWAIPQTTNRVVLYDRPNTSDQITAATLTFGDGSSETVGVLDNTAGATEILFAPRTVTSVRMTVTQVSGSTWEAGLAEFEVYAVDTGTNRPPLSDAGAAQTVNESDLVQLDGSGSFDPDGDLLSFSWSQTSGTVVVLSDPIAASPTFVAPSGLAVNEALGFQLVVNDGEFNSSASQVQVTVLAADPPGGTNIASFASSVTASSQRDYRGQGATSAIDGFIDGYPGDSTREWATEVERVGAWIQLDWSAPQTINRVVLYDRPNDSDQITAATLTFSDGSSETVGVLDNAGGATEILFASRTVTSVRMTVTQVSGSTWEAGLAEIEVYQAP